MTANEMVEDVGVVKLSKFESIINVVEEISVKKLTMIENITNVVEEVIDIKKHTEDIKNDVSGELEAQETEVVISMVEVESTPMPAVESKSEDCEFRNKDASLDSHDLSKGMERGQLQGQQHEKEVGAMVQAKVADKVVEDVEYVMAQEEKTEPDGDQIGMARSRGRDGGKLDEKKETKLDPFEEGNGELIYQKKTSDDIVVVGGEEAQEESIEKDIDVPINEVSTVDINDRSIKEVSPGSADYMLDDSQTTINKAVEVVGVEKPLEFKNIVDVVGDVGIKKHKEVENIATVVEGVDIKKHTEVVKDDSRGEIAAQDTESVIFVVELTKTPMVESKSLKGELWGWMLLWIHLMRHKVRK
ncbi:hypothetical protein PVAP13_3NG207112 [Panicum virgatum]|uniref:Uncharacterized protein n=1 Tax=Panicum virgatum TaxID=38727 RepID=A0A8T0U5Y4_PANVG|nr:hypothetical protein PVAP13_3NG207112 [Panicum virgatum]